MRKRFKFFYSHQPEIVIPVNVPQEVETIQELIEFAERVRIRRYKRTPVSIWNGSLYMRIR